MYGQLRCSVSNEASLNSKWQDGVPSKLVSSLSAAVFCAHLTALCVRRSKNGP